MKNAKIHYISVGISTFFAIPEKFLIYNSDPHPSMYTLLKHDIDRKLCRNTLDGIFFGKRSSACGHLLTETEHFTMIPDVPQHKSTNG